MKKTIILLVILSMSLGLLAQRTQQQNTTIKPTKQVKVNYEAKYYDIMKENDTLKIDNGRKDSEIIKILNELKANKNEVTRLQQGNAKLNMEKNSLSAEVQRMKQQIMELKSAGDVSKYKAEIESLKNENANLRVTINNSSKYKAEIESLRNENSSLRITVNDSSKYKVEIESLRTENAKLKAAMNGNKTKTKGKVIKVERQ